MSELPATGDSLLLICLLFALVYRNMLVYPKDGHCSQMKVSATECFSQCYATAFAACYWYLVIVNVMVHVVIAFTVFTISIAIASIIIATNQIGPCGLKKAAGIQIRMCSLRCKGWWELL